MNAFYRDIMGELPGVTFMPEIPGGRSTFWLTCVRVDPAAFGATRDDILAHLTALDIEARPLWKPMHLQPLYRGSSIRGGTVAADLFAHGLCLPSGSSLTDVDRERIAEALLSVPRS